MAGHSSHQAILIRGGGPGNPFLERILKKMKHDLDFMKLLLQNNSGVMVRTATEFHLTRTPRYQLLESRGFNSAVNRATSLLLALGQGRPSQGLSLTDLSTETSIHKATALRILGSLMQGGLVDRAPDGRFHIGMRLVELVSAYVEDLDLVEQSRLVLEGLCRETGETVHLGIPTAVEVVYVDKVESAQSLRMVSRVGTRNPFYCTALGKAVLAHASESDLSMVLAAGLEQRTANTLVSAEALRTDLAATRSRGYAIDKEENKVGIRCVAAKVCDRRGRVVGAISVSGPSVRMDDATCARFGEAVRRAADEVSRRLGYRPV